jgi:Domain of unknown function (DUF4382)
MMRQRRIALAALTGLASLALGCNGAAGRPSSQDATTTAGATAGASGSSSTALVSGPGRFSVSLTDAPNPELSKLVVTITSVTVHVVGEGWVPLPLDVDPPGSSLQVDLLQLQTYARSLGMLSLPPGKVTQIRLLVAPDVTVGTGAEMLNYVVLADAGQTKAPLKVPSGYQSGIKIVGPWEIADCTETAVTLDFDGKRSIWYHPTGQGNSPEETGWILRPVIRVSGSSKTPVACPPPESGQPPVEPPPAEPPPAEPPAGDPGTPPIPVEFGGTCAASAECISTSCVASFCGPGPAGAPCTRDVECVSGSCGGNGTCGIGSQGAACIGDGDCNSNACIEGTCGAGSTAPVGASCSSDGQCTSNFCSGGSCQPGFPGALCTTPGDCQSGICGGGLPLSCLSGGAQ